MLLIKLAVLHPAISLYALVVLHITLSLNSVNAQKANHIAMVSSVDNATNHFIGILSPRTVNRAQMASSMILSKKFAKLVLLLNL